MEVSFLPSMKRYPIINDFAANKATEYMLEQLKTMNKTKGHNRHIAKKLWASKDRYQLCVLMTWHHEMLNKLEEKDRKIALILLFKYYGWEILSRQVLDEYLDILISHGIEKK